MCSSGGTQEDQTDANRLRNAMDKTMMKCVAIGGSALTCCCNIAAEEESWLMDVSCRPRNA